MSMLSGDPRSLSYDAYTHLYPLVMMEVSRRQGVNVEVGAKPGFGPPNEFHHIRAFRLPSFAQWFDPTSTRCIRVRGST